MVPPSFSLPRVKKYFLPGGAILLHQKNPTSKSFCIGVWLKTGSRDECPGEEGLCHFLEHMLFKGTRKRSAFQISRAIEKVGGSLEAFTTKEHVCFYAQVLEAHKDLAIEVLSDMLTNSTFSEDQIEIERKVALQEISDVADSPDDLIHDLFASTIFPGHPLGRPVLGYPKVVSKFSRERITRFAARIFRSSNIIIAVCGNAEGRYLRRACERSFVFPDGEVTRPAPGFPKNEPKRRLFRRDLHQQHVCIGSRAFSYLEEKRFPLTVLTTLLGGGMSSRLFQRIREDMGLAYNIFTYAEYARDTGLIGTYMAALPCDAGRAVRVVLKELGKITDGEIEREELEDNKEYLKGRILLGLEGAGARMMQMAKNEIYYGKQVSETELVRRISRVSRDDIVEVASTVLDPESVTIVSLGPSTSGLNITRW